MIRFTPLLALFLVGCGLSARPNTAETPTQPDLDYPAGPFSLTERSGKTVTDRDLRGSVWVASFVFTRCNGPCPQVSSTLTRLQEELNLKDQPALKFVTFTVDPTRDDPAELRQYAKNRGAHPTQWLFLTGDETTIHKLLREQFKQAVERKSLEDAKPGDEFGHSTRLLVVDKEGVIRASFDGLPNERFPDSKERFEAELDRLKERVRELLR
jgi:cytochrome oxidase Cu insertion factor (SCO1/SenC/PrrC family)